MFVLCLDNQYLYNNSTFHSPSICQKPISLPYLFIHLFKHQTLLYINAISITFLHKQTPQSLTTSNMASSSMTISPRKLHSDLYSFSHQQDSSTPLVINVLASLIERNMARTKRIVKNCSKSLSRAISTNIFDCREIPDLSIQSYLERIFRYTKAGSSVYVVAYVYIDRFCQINPEFRINARNVHRLLITTIMVASKYVEDLNYRNSYFGRVGGLTTIELNKLELEFLFMMGFKLHVNVSVFESYCCHLEREVGIGGGYHIEKTLRCAEEIKARHRKEIRGYTQIPRFML